MYQVNVTPFDKNRICRVSDRNRNSIGASYTEVIPSAWALRTSGRRSTACQRNSYRFIRRYVRRRHRLCLVRFVSPERPKSPRVAFIWSPNRRSIVTGQSRPVKSNSTAVLTTLCTVAAQRYQILIVRSCKNTHTSSFRNFKTQFRV